MAFCTSSTVRPIGLELLRVEPDAHAVRAGAEHRHLADAGQARDRVLQVDDRVVAQEGLVVAIVVGVQALDQQDVGADLLTLTPCACTCVGSCGSAALAAFCTSASEVSRSVPIAKVTVSV